MKLLIGGKSRNIYMRKDGSAYYKSGGQQVDASFLFKKNGGGLKKQYIGGVEGNLAKVERKKRSNKCAKQILGGVPSTLEFSNIEIISENIMKADGTYAGDKSAQPQLRKICCLALYGLGAAMTGELLNDPDKDKITISMGKTSQDFKTYLDTNINDAVRKVIYVNKNVSDDVFIEAIQADFKKAPDRSELRKLGFTGIDFDGNGNGITVTRAYILNKILQCFDGNNGFYNDKFIADTDTFENPANGDLTLKDRVSIIEPATGKLTATSKEAKVKKLFNNIYKISMLAGENAVGAESKQQRQSLIQNSVTSLYKVLFVEEQIGTIAKAPAAKKVLDKEVLDKEVLDKEVLDKDVPDQEAESTEKPKAAVEDTAAEAGGEDGGGGDEDGGGAAEEAAEAAAYEQYGYGGLEHRLNSSGGKHSGLKSKDKNQYKKKNTYKRIDSGLKKKY